MKKLFLALVMVLCFSGSLMAYTIDGSLGDWGVDPSSPGSEDWTPNSGVNAYAVEDSIGVGSYYIGPGGGGQKFDAEAMYIDWDDTTLYVALVTGFPNTGTDGLSAGDIAIDFGNNGTYEYGIEVGGHLPGYTGYNGVAGGVYSGINWMAGSHYPIVDTAYMGASPTPLYEGSANSFVYANTYASIDPEYDHWVMEMSIPKSVFGPDWDNSMRLHWTQECGNDVIDVTTPEPVSLALFGTGLLGVFGFRRRKKA